MFECNFKCTMTGMIPNARIRCEMGVWSEIYFNHFHHLCMASEAKRPKIQPRRPLFTTAQPKTINEKAKISSQKSSLAIPKPTKKSSNKTDWNSRNAKLKTSTVHYFTDQWVKIVSSYFGSFSCTKYISENTWTSYCLILYYEPWLRCSNHG